MTLDAEAEGRCLARPVRQYRRIQIAVPTLEVPGLEPREGDADLEIQLLPRVDRQGLAPVRLSQGAVGLLYVRGVDRAEVRAVHAVVVRRSPPAADPPAAVSARHEMHAAIQHLEVNVLPLPIAIHPQYDKVHPPRLVLQMLHHAPLARLLLHGRPEQFGGIDAVPRLILLGKIDAEHVPRDARHPVIARGRFGSLGEGRAGEFVHGQTPPAR
mmetsp:Transcript_46608/g.141182  ORF Transcript_46608/g.141182 Transcript_46608/m.141182 type:complete len:213 (-) Transcript_46608:242-880(-)